jgi:DNA-binding FadR family transcriptional regulator
VSTDAVRRHHRALVKAVAKHDVAASCKIADTYMARGAEHLLQVTEARHG